VKSRVYECFFMLRLLLRLPIDALPQCRLAPRGHRPTRREAPLPCPTVTPSTPPGAPPSSRLPPRRRRGSSRPSSSPPVTSSLSASRLQDASNPGSQRFGEEQQHGTATVARRRSQLAAVQGGGDPIGARASVVHPSIQSAGEQLVEITNH
jgi:hypothetical protein